MWYWALMCFTMPGTDERCLLLSMLSSPLLQDREPLWWLLHDFPTHTHYYTSHGYRSWATDFEPLKVWALELCSVVVYCLFVFSRILILHTQVSSIWSSEWRRFSTMIQMLFAFHPSSIIILVCRLGSRHGSSEMLDNLENMYFVVLHNNIYYDLDHIVRGPLWLWRVWRDIYIIIVGTAPV